MVHYYVAEDETPWQGIEGLAAEHGKALCAATDAAGEPWERHSTDVRDVVGAVLAALDATTAPNEVFNIAAPQPMPMPGLTEYLAEKTGQEVIRAATPTRRRVNLSVEKIGDALYRPVYDYRRMIDDGLSFQAGEDIGVIAT